jgi:hypothetical protein
MSTTYIRHGVINNKYVITISALIYSIALLLLHTSASSQETTNSPLFLKKVALSIGVANNSEWLASECRLLGSRSNIIAMDIMKYRFVNSKSESERIYLANAINFCACKNDIDWIIEQLLSDYVCDYYIRSVHERGWASRGILIRTLRRITYQPFEYTINIKELTTKDKIGDISYYNYDRNIDLRNIIVQWWNTHKSDSEEVWRKLGVDSVTNILSKEKLAREDCLDALIRNKSEMALYHLDIMSSTQWRTYAQKLINIINMEPSRQYEHILWSIMTTQCEYAADQVDAFDYYYVKGLAAVTLAKYYNRYQVLPIAANCINYSGLSKNELKLKIEALLMSKIDSKPMHTALYSDPNWSAIWNDMAIGGRRKRVSEVLDGNEQLYLIDALRYYGEDPCGYSLNCLCKWLLNSNKSISDEALAQFERLTGRQFEGGLDKSKRDAVDWINSNVEKIKWNCDFRIFVID